MIRPTICPTCRSASPNVAAHNCRNPWHRGIDVHFQREPIGTPHAACHAVCGAEIEDAPSELAVGWEFVSCPNCLATAPACDRRHPAPSCADPSCYREQTARKADDVLPGLGDLVRKGKLDPDLPTSETTGEASERWNERATVIRGADDTWSKPAVVVRLHRDLSEHEIERATPEELRAAYRALRDHHVAETTVLASRRDDLARLLAPRSAAPGDPETTDYLSDQELANWIERAGLTKEARGGTYLRLVLDELRERRDAEAMFVDVDLQLQRLADCEACVGDTHGAADEHRAIVKRWRIARAALCALARIHRGYLRSIRSPDEGDPR